MSVLLFDLDETLMVEEPAAVAAFEATARWAARAYELGERFALERRARQEVFPEVEAVLRELSAAHVLGLVTNGASCLQRDKLGASGLGGYFKVVVVSGDVGVGKPGPSVFRRALAELAADRAVMVGDSVENDVRGALSAGLGAVWCNRAGLPRPEDLDVPEIASLSELPRVLEAI